jgi:hypothetical protein
VLAHVVCRPAPVSESVRLPRSLPSRDRDESVRLPTLLPSRDRGVGGYHVVYRPAP